jgi:pilus assembly protein FimV
MAAQQEAVDPVVEADTFLAFGRDAQAEEILVEALKTDPQRQAIHLKLLEIYSARKNVSQFESVAKELHALTGGSGAGWEKAAAMGAALDPGNSLYASNVPETIEEAPVATADLESTTVLRGGAGGLGDASQATVVIPAANEAAALDFDLDMGVADAASSATAAPQAAEHEAALDFDLDLGTPDVKPAPEAAPQASVSSGSAGLDIDFDMPQKESAPPALDFPLTAEKSAAPLATPAAASDPGSIDFDFDLSTPDAAPSAPLPAMSIELPAPAAPALDLSGISLELETPGGAPSAAPASSPSAEPAGADVPDNPDVVTKIELAMAYEEMGDRDGARELYQEALTEGSPAQQKVARAKLDGLS